MKDLKKGDIIVDKYGLVKEVVVARLEDLVWTKALHDGKPTGVPLGATDINDLINNGFRKEATE